ncbi:hypothetical protein QTP88_013424 [Uroleucon formosanum]
MGDKPTTITTISDDMNNTNSASQHIRNTTTFADIASNVTLPKMNQAIVLNSINNIKQIEYVIAITEKLKSSSNKIVIVTSPNPVKRPAPSTTSQPPSSKSSHSSNPPLTVKPPNAPEGKTQPSKNHNGNVHKKPKVRTSSSSNDSFYLNIDVGLNPTKDLFNSNPQMSLSLNQFKDFFENSQGCTDLESLCMEHHSSPENIIQIITNIYPFVTIKSIKNRLTRLSKALEKVRNINSSQTFYADSNDETY